MERSLGAESEASRWMEEEGNDRVTEFADEVWTDSMADVIAMTRRNQAPRGDDVFAVMHEGKAKYYQIHDPLLFRSLYSMSNSPELPKFIENWGKLRKGFQETITINPMFWARSIARDQLSAGILGRLSPGR